MRTVTLTIAGDPHELSPNARLHPYVRREKVRAWKARAFDAWEKAGRPRLTPPVHIQFCVRRARKVDYDGLAGSAALKAAIDALTDRNCPYQQSGLLLPDDGPNQVPLIWIGQQPGAEWKGREEVVMEVREIDGTTDKADG